VEDDGRRGRPRTQRTDENSGKWCIQIDV
jgi:hypothetical protein